MDALTRWLRPRPRTPGVREAKRAMTARERLPLSVIDTFRLGRNGSSLATPACGYFGPHSKGSQCPPELLKSIMGSD